MDVWIWSSRCPDTNPLSVKPTWKSRFSTTSRWIPPLPLPIGQAYQRAGGSGYRPGASDACLSSDKMDFQLSGGSHTGSARLGRLSALLHPASVCDLFFFLFFLHHPSITSGVLPHLSHPASLWALWWSGLTLSVWRLAFCWRSRYRWACLPSPHRPGSLNSGWIFN